MSELRAATVSNLAGTGPVTLTGQYAAKAWVNFNGTGTVAIRDSGNVSSITDLGGTGQYAINFSTSMSDTNYAVCGSAGPASSGGESVSPLTYATGSITIDVTINLTQVDRAFVNLAIFR
jgi:hypothetical protein